MNSVPPYSDEPADNDFEKPQEPKNEVPNANQEARRQRMVEEVHEIMARIAVDLFRRGLINPDGTPVEKPQDSRQAKRWADAGQSDG